MKSTKRIVLLLDDNEYTLRVLNRLLKRRFDTVLTATNASSAEVLLQNNKVTNLVCDHGVGSPSGGELIAHWRGLFPSIKRAVVLTGADVESIEIPPEVDCLISKAKGVFDIIAEIGALDGEKHEDG
jgi:ActR/RegA family two-component response regulator